VPVQPAALDTFGWVGLRVRRDVSSNTCAGLPIEGGKKEESDALRAIRSFRCSAMAGKRSWAEGGQEDGVYNDAAWFIPVSLPLSSIDYTPKR
jgi:hypothetical protein